MTGEHRIKEICALLQVVTGCAWDDALTEFAVRQADEIICGYCNIDEIPEGLTNTAVKMAIELLRSERYEKGAENIRLIESSVKVGDTQVSYTPVNASSAVTAPEEMTAGYAHALNRYRKLQMN